MPESQLDEYLDYIDRQIALRTYDLWRAAYVRGLVTEAELIRFIVFFDKQNEVIIQ